jgi:hypothetical protein
MDSMTLIAIASIVTAGLTIALGSARSATRCRNDHHANAFCWPGHD